ncbi:MAG: helix-turn-helix domain-containing protein [Acidimicrobiales bacterium]
MSETGELLRRVRLGLGWTQARLGRASGVPQSVVSAYESGAREPSVAALRRLARSAGFDVVLVPAPQPAPDPRAAARQLEDVLSLAEAMRLPPMEGSLRFPVLVRRG